MIKLGVIKIVDGECVVEVFKDGESVGKVRIGVSDEVTEERILNLLKLLEG